MAMADRRPLGNGFPVTSSTPASPSFNPKGLSSGVLSSSNSSVSSPSVSMNSPVTTSTDASAVTSNVDLDMAPNNYPFKSKVNDLKSRYSDSDGKPLTPEKSLSPVELSPTSRSISPDSLMNERQPQQQQQQQQQMSSSGYIKKPKNSSRAPIATGISTTIPVTGEKPKPEQKNDASLQDDVLYAIFLILYEKDAEGLGMTVKQICDTLVERHPEMANLSTKTSNLVSAKLNAYVKRVEKGDSNLKYALSRDWADASPKRMVYVYRGLLTEDFHLHVKNVMKQQQQQQIQHGQLQGNQQGQPQQGQYQQENSISQAGNQNISNDIKKFNSMVSAAGNSGSSSIKARRQTMFDLGVTKNTFLDTPIDKSNLFVPYSSAPVTASLSGEASKNNTDYDSEYSSSSSGIRNGLNDVHISSTDNNNVVVSGGDVTDADADNGSDIDFEDFEVFDDDDDDLIDIESFKTFNKAKRSKSLSYLTMGKKSKILTAAAAAPRASRSPSSHSPNAAAAAAALHAAAIKAMLPLSFSQSTDLGMKSGSIHNKKWLNVVRSGFMTQDIGTPEDISLSDLDKFFT
ncbi:protein Gds1p [[Candida] railenensis]|uniref:Protein Gds1p n=1 Tax=[Candida] railenensis TaxID=45579 RepID=A0A9P0VWP0_9ASCO|nr:protein Gds1p [[Candida] railenensis]